MHEVLGRLTEKGNNEGISRREVDVMDGHVGAKTNPAMAKLKLSRGN